LWLRPLDDDTYAITCIPFRTYGLALGDRVRLSPDGTLVTEVVELSGRGALRMLLIPGTDPELLNHRIARIRDEIKTSGLLSEWSGDRHVAVDIPADANASNLFVVMHREVAEGTAFWEWADVHSFSA
jgi:hypothetical protein